MCAGHRQNEADFGRIFVPTSTKIGASSAGIGHIWPGIGKVLGPMSLDACAALHRDEEGGTIVKSRARARHAVSEEGPAAGEAVASGQVAEGAQRGEAHP